MNVPYIPGRGLPPELPLRRFLPPIPEGMVAAWCRDKLSPGDNVLEPFGFNPLVPIEIALSGHPVLVTVNNPVHAFMLQVLASAPQKDDFIAALQDLAVASKGDDRMEPYIRSLYHVHCTDCHRRIEADAFLWRKEDNAPYAALVTCPHCGARGEQAITEETSSNFAPLPPVQLHRARALNRIILRNDPLRQQVSQALNAYPVRPLIVLQTIINKLENLDQSPRRRDLLTALILSAADQGNTLWAYPLPRNRPRQIVVPPVYQEKNLWKVMEEAVETWQYLSSPIPISEWTGTFGDTPSILRFQGRIKDLAPQIEGVCPVILAAIPRPNQAFWTLSTLWTGWIWGQAAVAPIRQVLSRQRYEWNWHTNALNSVFATLHNISEPDTKFWGIVAENEPLLLLASLLACDSAGFKLSSFAQSYDDEIAQLTWVKQSERSAYSQPRSALDSARSAVADYLKEKGEPATYQQVHAAAITNLAHENKLSVDTLMENPNQAASETNSLIETLFTEPGLLTRAGEKTASLETGLWWLAGGIDPETPLIDCAEELIHLHLIDSQQITSADVKAKVYSALPGILTPEDEVLLNCLESYADLVKPEEHLWSLRASEGPEARQADMNAMGDALRKIGQRLEYQVKGTNPLVWTEPGEPFPAYHFQILSTAIVYPHIQKELNARYNVLLIPGSRANLLAYKTQRDPLLKRKLDHHFLLMKYRLVRDLEANPLISRELFKEQILVDPPEYRSSQLALF